MPCCRLHLYLFSQNGSQPSWLPPTTPPFPVAARTWIPHHKQAAAHLSGCGPTPARVNAALFFELPRRSIAEASLSRKVFLRRHGIFKGRVYPRPHQKPVPGLQSPLRRVRWGGPISSKGPEEIAPLKVGDNLTSSVKSVQNLSTSQPTHLTSSLPAQSKGRRKNAAQSLPPPDIFPAPVHPPPHHCATVQATYPFIRNISSPTRQAFLIPAHPTSQAKPTPSKPPQPKPNTNLAPSKSTPTSHKHCPLSAAVVKSAQTRTESLLASLTLGCIAPTQPRCARKPTLESPCSQAAPRSLTTSGKKHGKTPQPKPLVREKTHNRCTDVLIQ